MKYLIQILLMSLSIVAWGQHTQIDYNSSTGVEGPQLLLLETDDDGNEAGEDGWSRMWFRNSVDPINRWGFLARPHTGATDNDSVLISPLVMAYTGVQKFGFGMDGHLAINKSYVLPNRSATAGKVLMMSDVTLGMPDTTSMTEWGYIRYLERNSTVEDPVLQFHEKSFGSSVITFSNNQFPNNRFVISADPSNTAGVDAKMSLGWASVGGVSSDILTINAAHNKVSINGDDESDDYALHVNPDSTISGQTAAHFGPHPVGALGFVTINKPGAGNGVSIMRLKYDDATVAAFDDDEISFWQPVDVRDKLTVFSSDLELGGGSTAGDLIAKSDVRIDGLLYLKPKTADPAGTCAEGELYLQKNVAGTNYKLRVCDASNTWIDLN